MKKIIFWLPRQLAILFALFLGVFALDVFGISGPIWKKLSGLIIHLIPTIIILIGVMYTWKKPVWASFIFTILFVVATLYFHTYKHSLNFAIISLPILIIAILYALDYIKNKKT